MTGRFRKTNSSSAGHTHSPGESFTWSNQAIKWVMHIHKEPRCSPFIHEFLDFIETQMLVVSLDNRCDCSSVASTLKNFLDRCHESKQYCDVGEVRRWAIWKSNMMTLKANIHRLNRTINYNGLAVAAVALIVLVLTTLLIFMFGPRANDMRIALSSAL
ncbi:hypothetical protein F4779DRAFT_596969 [Xylariaceae sp. FL0662B]|nr:hypothetical protein F4779DRAFT_596969 [Xylariaceae sp. FL0662B]